ncbi:hypothetical protein MNBD_ALPHA06-1811, partial [hydrothermal vent metagenome]
MHRAVMAKVMNKPKGNVMKRREFLAGSAAIGGLSAC